MTVAMSQASLDEPPAISSAAVFLNKDATSHVTTAADENVIRLKDCVPEGIEIRPTAYGLGMFVNKHFPAGSIIYTGQARVIPNRFQRFLLETDQGTFPLDTETHSVAISETERHLYLFDAFMNHSCDPSTHSFQFAESELEYHTMCRVDMKPGDEITCDYNVFEYDCKGKEIFKCECRTKACIGEIRGFKFLTLADKKARISMIDDCVLQWYCEENPNVKYEVLDSKIPDSIKIEKIKDAVGDDDPELRMTANKHFQAGDVIFYRQSQFLSEDETVIIKIAGTRMWLGPRHIVEREGKRFEFFGFDSFQNHSCDPNTIMSYNSDRKSYCLRAVRSIAPGDELFSDYETFDPNIDGVSFMCCCGTTKCRGIVRA